MADSQARAGPSGSQESSWWSSIKKPFTSNTRVQNSDLDEDDEDEPLLPSRLGKRRGLRTGWEQMVAYVVILALGVVVGGFIGRKYSNQGGGKGHGPMVAPVWTLPPVCVPYV